MDLRATTMAFILATLAAAASAQEQTKAPLTSILVVGSRVRLVSTAVQARPQGLVVALDESTLTLATDAGTPLKLPTSSITALETSLGRKRNTLKGLGIGVVSGLLLGLAFSVDPNDCGYYSSHFCSRGEAVAGGALGFAALGAGVGALVKSDRWSPVLLGAPARRARHGPPAAGLGVTIRF